MRENERISFASTPVGTSTACKQPVLPGDEQSSSLLGIATRIDRFLESVAARLHLIMNEFDDIRDQKAQINIQSSELQQDRNEWERKHRKEVARLHSESEQLAEAWTRIEEQERNQELGHRAQSEAPIPTAEPPLGDLPADGINNGNDRGDPDPRVAVIKTGVRGPSQQEMTLEISPAEILMQFQQLNRDIRYHARQNR